MRIADWFREKPLRGRARAYTAGLVDELRDYARDIGDARGERTAQHARRTLERLLFPRISWKRVAGAGCLTLAGLCSFGTAITPAAKETPNPTIPAHPYDWDVPLIAVDPAPETPILMYHDVGRSEDRFTVSPERLWSHLDYLRENGYTLVTFSAYTRGVPAANPAVLTFDDSTAGQFTLENQAVSAASAVGVLEAYRSAHPGFTVTATFFVNLENDRGETTFAERGREAEKLAYLVSRGYEIGAHGARHEDFAAYTTQELVRDLIAFDRRLRDWLPGYKVRAFAYPYGSLPGKEHQEVVEAFFPYTAHAWGGTAKGETVNVPRIEVGPATRLARYAPPAEANVYKRPAFAVGHARRDP